MSRPYISALALFLFVLVPVAWAEAPTQPQPVPPLPDFSSAAVPDTYGLPSKITRENQYAWDLFAWQTFIAMNWPAIEPRADNGYQRGFPDLSKSFLEVGEDPETPLVWETFKEKREMFRHGIRSSAEDARPTYWNSDYLYGPDGESHGEGAVKRLYSSAKFATLDETVEVRAEALESFYNGSKYFLKPAVARVYRENFTPASDETAGSAVRYEVKVNFDFWRYVTQNELYFDPTAQARSTRRPPVQLPWRTSLKNPGVSFLTQKAGDPPYVPAYSAVEAMTAYQKAQHVKTQDPHAAPVPPRIGAIHLKAAWARIDEGEKDKFIHRRAEYFYSEGGEKKSSTDLFGLIGLHIIQRIKVRQPNKLLNNDALGGTFIYSTWEHVDIREEKGGPGTQYLYTNFFTDAETGKMISSPDPAESLFDIYRLYPILPHTRRFNENLQSHFRGHRGSEVWANYRLVGTQFAPVNMSNDGAITNQDVSPLPKPSDQKQPAPNYGTNPNSYDGPENSGDMGLPRPLGRDEIGGQPAYLANLVIESNLGLQQFQGLPPNVRPVPQFASRPGTSPNLSPFYFDRKDGTNVFYGGTAMNTGGCMGCHGVAQTRGYSFSFVLLGGQAGADPDTEADFAIPFTSRNLLEQGESISLVPILFGAAPVAAVGPGESDRAMLSFGSGVLPTLRLESKHPRPTYASFQYGDDPAKNGVYLRDQFGLYLTATDEQAAAGEKQVRFAEDKSDAAVWYFFDAEDPGNEADVLQGDYLSFKNAAVRLGNKPAFLTQSGSDVNVTATISGGNISEQVWTAAIQPLYPGSEIEVINNLKGDRYLVNKTGGADGEAFLGTRPASLKLEARDSRVPGSPLFYGDGVYLIDDHGNYLSATEEPAAVGNRVSFKPQPKDPGPDENAVWYLYDPFDPASTQQVNRLGLISFRNAAVTFPRTGHYLERLPAFLSFDGAAGPNINQVIVLNHASPVPHSNELWNVVYTQEP